MPDQLRSRCLSVIASLPVPDPFDLEQFRVNLERQQRPQQNGACHDSDDDPLAAFYLARLAQPDRRDPAGLAGFTVFGALACALLVLRTVN